MRFDGGGDYTKTAAFMADLPWMVPPEREAVGATLSDDRLPNSGISMSYATGLHDYLHGCHWFGSCFWVDWIYPIAVPTLKPDLAAPLTFALVAAGRDPAMQAIGRAPGLRRPGIL
jgi:hypothetical protein